MKLKSHVQWIVSLLLLGAVLPLSGCFSERSFPVRMEGVVRVQPPAEARTVRDWTAAAARQLQPLLPARHIPALATDELVDASGKAIDVYAHFGTDPKTLASVFENFFGLLHTAQCSHTTVAEREPPVWPGFEDVWIPVDNGVRVFGRIGLAKRDGKPVKADCIVILPGLLGDLSVDRTRTIAEALVANGIHALAVELRGYGKTDHEQPGVYYTFGVLETGDLQAIAEWAQAKPEVDRTGLIGFCWGANHALLAAWDDGRPEDHLSVSARLRPFMRARGGAAVVSGTNGKNETNGTNGTNSGRRAEHYAAGVIAFSPVLAFEEVIERTRTPTSALVDPVLNTLQDGIRERQALKGHVPVDGDLRKLIESEFARSTLSYDGSADEGIDYLRFLTHRGRDDGDKLESARLPVLIVHGSTDPLASAQAVAECVARTKNPNVGVLMTEGGGHVGFASYSRDWFYSVILNFFDPVCGAGATAERRSGKVGRWESGKGGAAH